MVEGRGLPSIRGVADETIMVELTCRVVGCGDAVIVVDVAVVASGWIAAVLPADMTLFAVDRPMRTGQREGGCFMVEGRGPPGVGDVALGAIVVELTGSVARCSRSVIVVFVAGKAG